MAGYWQCFSMLFLFKINDSDKFAPYDALPTLVLSHPQRPQVDLFTFCIGCPLLKRKLDLDCILLSQGQIHTTVMLYGGNMK